MSTGGFIAVVLNYRRAQETLESLGSLSGSHVQPSRTLVVDNHSEDGSSERIKAARPDVDLVEPGENLGYAGGMNAGLRHALDGNEEYVLIINSDTLVRPDTVSRLIRALDDRPEAGAATGTFTYYPDTQRVWYAGGAVAYGRAHAVTNRVIPGLQRADGSPVVQAVTFLTGCAMLLRTSALRTAGMFDERYFMYLEDVELSARFLGKGFQLLYVPGAMFSHRLDVDEQTPLKTYYVTRNRLLLLKSAPSALQRARGTAYLSLVLAIKSLWWILTNRRLAEAAFMGVQDYRAGRLHAGRGLSLAVHATGNRREHADLH